MSWQFSTAGRVVFGRGTSGQIGQFAQRLKVARPLMVSDEKLAALGITNRLTQALEASGCQVRLFTGCEPEPPFECAMAGAEVAREHECDGIVAIGGGSNIDVAKMIAVLVRYGGHPSEYFGFDRVPGPVMPLIACPTTTGTGSEVSHSAVLTDRAGGTKVSTLSPYLRPAVALVDPELTDSCPATVTAHSGIDALVHAIEAITARRSEQMPAERLLERAYDGAYGLTRLLGLEAVRLIGRSLVKATHNGSDRAARDDMAQAAMLAGMAFSNSGVALVHALEYPVGVLTHCSHGEGNGLLLPHVMRFNLESRVSEFAHIAQAMNGEPCSAEMTPEHAQELASQAVRRVESLQSELGIRKRLRDLGLARDAIPDVAAKAFGIKRLMDSNPRAPTEADLVTILEAAF